MIGEYKIRGNRQEILKNISDELLAIHGSLLHLTQTANSLNIHPRGIRSALQEAAYRVQGARGSAEWLIEHPDWVK